MQWEQRWGARTDHYRANVEGNTAHFSYHLQDDLYYLFHVHVLTWWIEKCLSGLIMALHERCYHKKVFIRKVLLYGDSFDSTRSKMIVTNKYFQGFTVIPWPSHWLLHNSVSKRSAEQCFPVCWLSAGVTGCCSPTLSCRRAGSNLHLAVILLQTLTSSKLYIQHWGHTVTPLGAIHVKRVSA